jgi:hypothetical protein
MEKTTTKKIQFDIVVSNKSLHPTLGIGPKIWREEILRHRQGTDSSPLTTNVHPPELKPLNLEQRNFDPQPIL